MKPLTTFNGFTAQFMVDLVKNQTDRFFVTMLTNQQSFGWMPGKNVILLILSSSGSIIFHIYMQTLSL